MPAEHVYVPHVTPLMTAEDLLKPGMRGEDVLPGFSCPLGAIL